MTQVQQGEDVLAELVRMLVDVVGEDSLAGAEVTRGMTLNDDLALEGIEFVELSQRLRQAYGERVELTAILADLDLERFTRLTVGDLVRHIESRLS
jgi:acyl carrier protein